MLDVLEACGGPRLEVGQPGPFQFAAEGSLARELARAGFDQVQESAHAQLGTWPGVPASLWQFTRETPAPLFDPLLSSISSPARTRLEASILASLAKYPRGDRLEIPVEERCARGKRPAVVQAGA